MNRRKGASQLRRGYLALWPIDPEEGSFGQPLERLVAGRESRLRWGFAPTILRAHRVGALLCISAEAAFTGLSPLVYTAPDKA
jgi:hypothetical protein